MTAPPPTDLDARVAAFEAAWATAGSADLAAFLPPPDEPGYRAVLRELALIDLEFAAGARTAADLCARFPDLAADPAFLAAATRTTPAEEPGPKPAAGWLDRAAALYADLHADGPPTAVGGSVEVADLILELQAAADSPDDTVAAPVPGFRLVRELGRGTFGRVYLAEQTDLANRRVALKIGTGPFDEAHTLAQLQHSNIVPVYSVHAVRGHRAVCMPYLGATTLADVLKAMRARGPSDANPVWSTLAGRSAVTEPAGPEQPAGPRPAPATLDTLKKLTPARAALWVGARLADGLAHAHERGVLHRDLKPANVLIADDGTPLLLDFNLSGDARVRGGVPAVLGGTLPYMAPEHLEAFQGGVRPVDARSDIYALGLMLFELLTGHHPFPVPTGKVRDQVPILLAERVTGPPDPGPGVSPATAAILRHCLEPDPGRRYPTARALAEDLQRQLDDRPLRHAREPFGRERLTKFVRRNPRTTAAAVVVAAGLLLAVGGALYVRQARESATVAAANQLRDFRDDYREARAILGMPDPTVAARGEEICRRALGRFNGTAWDESPAFHSLRPDEQAEVRRSTGELLLLLARALWLRGEWAEALDVNARAAGVVGEDRRRAVVLQRALLEKRAGRTAEADRLLAEGRAIAPQTARDHWLRAGELFAERRFREADGLLDAATREDPGDAIAWATRAACATALGEHARAAALYTTAIALRPDYVRAYEWRAGAYLEAGAFAAAIADFDTVLGRQPDHVGALVLRGLARFRANDLPGAEADLTRVIDLGSPPTRAWFLRARVRSARGDATGAAADTAAGLKSEPTDAIGFAARGDARLDAHDVPGALADYDAALQLYPGFRDAAQSKAHTLSEHLNKPAEAIAVLNDLVEIEPDYTEARVGRGVLLARLGKRAEAHVDAEESVKRDGRPLIAYQAGCVYALTAPTHAGDADRAFALLEKAIRGGFGAEHVEADADLAAVRADRRYRGLAELAKALRK